MMKFIVKKISDSSYNKEIDLKSLEELIEFVDKEGEEVRGIVMNRDYPDEDMRIIIFDGYYD